MFCNVCGEFTVKSQRRGLKPLVKKANELYSILAAKLRNKTSLGPVASVVVHVQVG